MTLSPDEIRRNIEILFEKIAFHAEKVGRDPKEIKLVAVTKTHPAEVIRSAYQIGLRSFGENYAQELRDKAKTLAFDDIEWHFIGRIQTNKLKYVVPVAEYIQSVYRKEEMEEIEKIAVRIGKKQKVLIEVNVSGEETKGGIKTDDVQTFVEECLSYRNVEIVGLMTMAPFIEPENTRHYFKKLFALREELRRFYPNIIELSMGMTNDFTVAIEEGSTMLRIGTAIFGEREYKKD
ncbi:MAG TPA: YggS family pyridoxal phosphate-dependent enzyme [Fervidobacterium sp.]|nr:YggS family pyridoxal phosphate-dependent enzyme [Fervidobacterium sp.]